MFMDTQFDYILEITPSVNEAKLSGSFDKRVSIGTITPVQDYFSWFTQTGVGSTLSFGPVLRNSLQLGAGYSTEVVDFGDAVTVKITYTNTKTAQSHSQSFVILFNKNGKCNVKSSSARWRSCNDVSQAASFIRGKATSLSGKTSSIS
jgi:hypothetical protein